MEKLKFPRFDTIVAKFADIFFLVNAVRFRLYLQRKII